jgi:hypothetical protein
MQDKEPTEEEIQRGSEQMEKIHQAVCVPAEALIAPAMERGVERWEVAVGFLYAAFHVLETMEEDWEQVEIANMLINHAKIVGHSVIDQVLEERRKAKAVKPTI